MNVTYQMEQITDKITRILLPGQVFAYLVKGTERAALIDTGLGVGDLRAYVESLLDGMPYEVILTHGHLDHAAGAARFDRVWIRREDIPMASADNKAERAAYTRGNGFTDFWDEELDDSKTEGWLELEYGQTFDLGGETLEIVCLGGHTPGSVGILFRNQRILLTGDACCSFTLLFGEPGSLSVADYKANLEAAWAAYKDKADRNLYSHPHNYGGPEVIPQMIELCGEILAGKDDHISMEAMGRESYLAKAMGPDMKRADGGIANLAYT